MYHFDRDEIVQVLSSLMVTHSSQTLSPPSGIIFYHPDTKNATIGSRSSCLGVPLPFPPPPTTQTRRTRPCGRVFHVWVSLCPSLHLLPDTKNAILWSRSSCLGCPFALPFISYHPDTKNVTLWSGCPSAPPSTSYHPDTKTRPSPHGLVLVFGHVPLSLPCLKHHNMPVWACSGAQAPLLSPSLLSCVLFPTPSFPQFFPF